MKNTLILIFLSMITAGGLYVIQKNMMSPSVAAAVMETREPNLFIVVPMSIVVATSVALFICYWKHR